MEMTSLAKDLIGFQKQAAWLDVIALFQDQAERTNRYFANQMGISDRAQENVDQWRMIFNKGRDESRRFINGKAHQSIFRRIRTKSLLKEKIAKT